MIRRLRAMRPWLRAVRASEERNYEEALNYYSDFQTFDCELLQHRAFRAKLLVLAGHDSAAMESLTGIISDIERNPNQKDDPKTRYILKYCQLTKAGLVGSEERDLFRREIQKISVPNYLRKLIPVS